MARTRSSSVAHQSSRKTCPTTRIQHTRRRRAAFGISMTLLGRLERDSDLEQALPAIEARLLHELAWSRQATLDTDVLSDIADDDSLSLEHRFNAYFVWQTALWRRYDHKEFRNNVRNYSDVFSSLPMFDHQQAMALLSRSDRPSLQEALRYARDACRKVPSSPGVLGLLAKVVAEMGERHPDTVGQEDITEALDSIGKAIRNRPTARKVLRYPCPALGIGG